MYSFRIGSTRLLTFVSAAALTACAGGPNPETAAPSHMYAHYEQVGELRTAVINGDLGETRGPARWLASHKGDEFPAQAQEYLEQMRAEGRIILAQNELTDVANSVARMGVACGSCHTALNGGPKFKATDAPAASTGPDAHMIRHAWAIDRLWDGIIGPSDGAWTEGVSALTGAPLDFGTDKVPAQAGELSKKVHELASTARQAHTPKQRAEVYGQLLQTCELCHSVLGMRQNH